MAAILKPEEVVVYFQGVYENTTAMSGKRRTTDFRLCADRDFKHDALAVIRL